MGPLYTAVQSLLEGGNPLPEVSEKEANDELQRLVADKDPQPDFKEIFETVRFLEKARRRKKRTRRELRNYIPGQREFALAA